jgi:hypothetical protein
MTYNIDPVLLNFLYAFLGGVMTLFFMWTGCYLWQLQRGLREYRQGLQASTR